ncbi:R-spondin-2-like [Physella acuta]|uniref:R-spondin-2-like n=1 Tax=Physella acuta TaxID=109671 RepID=UPI0027DBC6C9|nr:R-spondin-2-like [Physella acuta]
MLWLSTFLYHLILCEYIFRSVKASGRIRRTIVGRFPLCPRGCTACSPVNGCVACEDSLYLFLHRQNAREIGICTLSCPVGYYRQREQYFNKCVKCHIRNCYNCFSRQFCVMCESPYLLYGGQCVESCPNGLYYANFTNECKDRVDCIPGGWSPWTECTRNGQTCGFRYGTQTRTRPVLQPASANGEPCPALTDSQRCQLAQRHCDGECQRPKRNRKKKKRKDRRRRKKWRRPGGRRFPARRGRKWGGRRRDNRKYPTRKKKVRLRRPCRGCKMRCRRGRIQNF